MTHSFSLWAQAKRMNLTKKKKKKKNKSNGQCVQLPLWLQLYCEAESYQKRKEVKRKLILFYKSNNDTTQLRCFNSKASGKFANKRILGNFLPKRERERKRTKKHKQKKREILTIKSRFGSQHQHDWIELIFGFKQRRRAAMEACKCVLLPYISFSLLY